MEARSVAAIVTIIVVSIIVLNGKAFGDIISAAGSNLVSFTKAANGTS